MTQRESVLTRVPRYLHLHPPVQNVNELVQEQITPGERAADTFARIIGSWRFIIAQSIVLLIWMMLNVTAWVRHWDPYPFILLNLALSFQAAYSGPIIMMSQNRQAAKDRIAAELDYEINLKAEDEIEVLLLRAEETERVVSEILALLRERENGDKSDTGFAS